MTVSDSRLLIVDDNQDNRYTLNLRLKRLGYSAIEEAENGLIALQMLREGPYDLVLLDVMMPEMNGTEVLEEIKKDKELRHIPVIMISANDQIENVVRCVELGAEDYLPKPFNPTLLRARISASLEKKQLREIERDYAETHDLLTGLPNQPLFIHLVDQVLKRPEHTRWPCAVLRVDLDKYADIHDTLGPSTSEKVVIEAARRFSDCVGELDVVARIGGGEFILLFDNFQGESQVTRRVCDLQTSLSRPIQIEETEVFTTITIGTVLSTSGYDNGHDMVRDAGLALRRAKQSGENRHEMFDQDMHVRALTMMKMEGDLHKALANNELVLFYQPIYDLHDNSIAGFEALMRWRHPEDGLVRPDHFIPLAEETNLIIPMGTWAFEEACNQSILWNKVYGSEKLLTIAVNVSSRQIMNANFIETIEDIIRRTGVDKRTIKIEVTESLIMDNPAQAESKLKTIREMGIGVSMDDFGTGYSSLSYLHNFPFNSLKIDQSFVRDIDKKEENRAIIQAITMLADAFGMDVVAEGIESQEELEVLKGFGSEYAQGYYFSHPLEAGEAEDLLADNVAKETA